MAKPISHGLLRETFRVLADAFGHFSTDDGWAMASHVALSTLLALFPFLIFIAALAGFLGFGEAATEVSKLIFDAWPDAVAAPVAREINKVLTVPRGDLLTFGVIAALWFASNGVSAVRVALNRAYRIVETRNFLLLRLQALVVVVLGSVALIAFTVLIVLAPLVIAATLRFAPALAPWFDGLHIARYVVAGLLSVVGLLVVHLVLPAGRRRLVDILPGVLLTLVLWIGSGAVFGYYLASYANYVSTYAGLAGVMTALVFLYIVALALLAGGELNASLLRARRIRQRRRVEQQTVSDE
ncbi:YihY/virulence factor BrkB family protein [Pannonibacter carbonis]|uniref:YihY/virulence factor BrkB family protein n=1 Tax=Pannonibacter carbonis TaxID=2067569 RepID=UPI000D0F38E8|nr:YihY/virulence factor BrkB family protein [Pannonibacter carbonis]